jgi:hypothetical protein
LAHGWAARAGTPANLLGGKKTATTPPATTVTSAATALPTPPYSAALTGTITETTPDSAGNTAVTIAAKTTGGVHADLKIVLDGISDGNGGLTQMTGNSASFGPTSNPTLYAGKVVTLQANQVDVSFTGSSASPPQLLVNTTLQINLTAGTLTGQLQAS